MTSDRKTHPPGARRIGWRRCLTAFRRDRRGSTAVEFAMLALPFLSLVFAIFETSMVHMTSQVLQTAVTEASRKIMTGQAQKGGLTAADFKNEVCKNVKAFFNCANDLKVDVQSFGTFAAASVPPAPIKNGGLDASGFGYSPGGPNQIVVVRAAIEYKLVVPSMISNTMANLSGQKLLIMASAAFKNEPYN